MPDVLQPDITCLFDKSDERHPWKQARDTRNAVEDLAAFRVAPLLLFIAASEDRADDPTRVVVGSVAVAVRDRKPLILKIFVAGVWHRLAGEKHFQPVDDEATEAVEAALVVAELEMLVRGTKNSTHGLTGQNLAAQCAKAISENSRDGVQHLRDSRYTVEQALAKASVASGMTAEHTRAVSSLIYLNVVCGRAGDQAREAIREGLCLWLDDDQAYHAYRKLRDPMILNRVAPASVRTRSWMRLHDASIRQCEELQRQLQSESDAIRSLIQSGASISSARDAEEQAKSNMLTAVISIGLGVPALVLTFYGASALLPLSGTKNLMAFVPVAAALVGGAVVAYIKTKGSRRIRRWICVEAMLLMATLVLLILAGILAPSS